MAAESNRFCAIITVPAGQFVQRSGLNFTLERLWYGSFIDICQQRKSPSSVIVVPEAQVAQQAAIVSHGIQPTGQSLQFEPMFLREVTDDRIFHVKQSLSGFRRHYEASLAAIWSLLPLGTLLRGRLCSLLLIPK
jgi:hypothetical protein